MSDEITRTRRAASSGIALILIALGVLMTHQVGYLRDGFVATVGAMVILIGLAVVAKVAYLDYVETPETNWSETEGNADK